MRLTAILCNYAEAQNGVLYLSGAGIDRYNVQQNTEGPWPLNLGIGISIKVPWTATNQMHKLELTLKDADGQEIQLPNGEGSSAPLRVEMNFNVGRPPILEAGEEQLMNLAINLPGLPVAKLGVYIFTLSVDGTKLEELRLKVSASPNISLGQSS